MAPGSDLSNLIQAAQETLSAIPNDPRDAALRVLIRQYADEIEKTGTTEKLGSKLLSALREMQATPLARRADALGDDPASELEAFLGHPAGP